MPTQSLTFVRLEDTPYGGAENYLRRLTDELNRRNISHDTLHSNAPKWMASWLKALCFNREARQKKAPGQCYFSLARIDSADIYRAGDGVHRVFMQKLGKSFLSNPLHIVNCWLEKRCFNQAKAIIANSEYVKRQIMETYGIPDHKIHVIYNGITLTPNPSPKSGKGSQNANLNDFPHKSWIPAPARMTREFGLKPGQKIMLFVGSGFKRKGADIFLKLISQLNANYHAFIIGKDKKLAHYQQLAKKYGIADKVTFTGQRQDIGYFYQAADILLFPTRYEPFSNVVLEALANRCVAITSDQNGAHEILPNEWVLTQKNQTEMIQYIDTLLQNDQKLMAAKQGALAIAKQYPIQRSLDETLKLIDSLKP